LSFGDETSLANQPIEDVDAVIFEAVEKGLEHFGPTFKPVVFHELKVTYNLDSRLIGRKPNTFSEFLDRLFSIGAVSIRKAIIREIGIRFSLPTNHEDIASVIQKARSSSYRMKD
jgi:hypothetical protein